MVLSEMLTRTRLKKMLDDIDAALKVGLINTHKSCGSIVHSLSFQADNLTLFFAALKAILGVLRGGVSRYTEQLFYA